MPLNSRKFGIQFQEIFFEVWKRKHCAHICHIASVDICDCVVYPQDSFGKSENLSIKKI